MRRDWVVVYTTNTTPYSDECLLPLIRARAYELFEMRGQDNGHALDDWTQAERESEHHLGLWSCGQA